MRFLPHVLVADTLYTVTVFAKTLTSKWGHANIKFTTNQAPYSGRLDAVPETNIISMQTKVTFSASNWMDVVTDRPLAYRFGYILGNSTVIMREYSTQPSMTTDSLPMGILQPVLWIRDSEGATREARYGCTTYKDSYGVFATDTDCPNAKYLTVSPPALTAGQTYTTAMTAKLTAFSLSRNGPRKAVLFAGSAAQNANQDDTGSSACDAACIVTGNAIRIQMFDLIDNAIATNQLLALSALFSTTATISIKASFFEDSTTRIRANTLFDTLLSQGVTNGLDLTSGTNAVEILSSITTATKSATNALTKTTAAKIISQAKSISNSLLKSVAKNDPVTSVTKVGSNGKAALEIAGIFVSKSTMIGAIFETPNIQAVMPNIDFTGNAAPPPAIEGEYRVLMAFFSESLNPYSYDSTYQLQSGLTSVSLADTSGNELTVSGLTKGY